MPSTVTGENARVAIGTHAADVAGTPTITNSAHSVYGIGDFSITLDRGVISQDLIGVAGPYQDQGSLSIDGSFTMSKFGAQATSKVLENILDGTGATKYFVASANIGSTNPLGFYFISCQVTGYDFSVGDADTVTECSVDFIILNPQDVKYKGGITYG